MPWRVVKVNADEDACNEEPSRRIDSVGLLFQNQNILIMAGTSVG
jgi:hypothetical protein